MERERMKLIIGGGRGFLRASERAFLRGNTSGKGGSGYSAGILGGRVLFLSVRKNGDTVGAAFC